MADTLQQFTGEEVISTDLVPKLNNNFNYCVPTGGIVEYAGTTAPNGWLLCDGSAISRTTYADLFEVIPKTDYPHDYLECTQVAKKELKKWFNMVSNKSKERVCIIHNNLSLKHFIRADKNYLISWDKYKVDTPVLDIYNFYKKEGFKLDFKYLMKVYSENIELLEEEKKLLYILISIPPKLINIKEEYLNTINIKEFYDYIYCGMGIVNENK